VFAAVNFCVRKYCSEYLWWTYLNDDDRLLPGFAAVLDQLGKATRNDCIYAQVSLDDCNGQRLTRTAIAKRPWLIGHYFSLGLVPFTQQGTVFSMSVFSCLGGFDLSYKLVADTEFLARAHLNGFRFVYVNSVAASYRIHGMQLSADRDLQTQEHASMLRGRRVGKSRWYSRIVVWFSILFDNFDVIAERFLRQRMISTKGIVAREQIRSKS